MPYRAQYSVLYWFPDLPVCIYLPWSVRERWLFESTVRLLCGVITLFTTLRLELMDGGRGWEVEGLEEIRG